MIEGMRRPFFYVLVGHTALPLADGEFDQWKGAASVALSMFKSGTVSTIFLGVDHRFHDDGLPLLFETLVLSGPHKGYEVRSPTWELAESTHRQACDMVRAGPVLSLRGRLGKGCTKVFKPR
jgi:hypothetical protein